MLLLVMLFLVTGSTCLRHVPLTDREIEFINLLDKNIETVDIFVENDSFCVLTSQPENKENSGIYL